MGNLPLRLTENRAASKNCLRVSLRLGQASSVLTLETYSQVLPSLQKDAADRMESLLFATA
jgi:hypothetical protein